MIINTKKLSTHGLLLKQKLIRGREKFGTIYSLSQPRKYYKFRLAVEIKLVSGKYSSLSGIAYKCFSNNMMCCKIVNKMSTLFISLSLHQTRFPEYLLIDLKSEFKTTANLLF